MSGQTVAYARVSSADQNLDRQLAALGEYDEIFTDKVSGKGMDRPGLQDMIKYVRKGDTLRVKSIDRLGRSARDLLNILEQLEAKGVKVEFVDTPTFNTDTKEGRFALTVFAAMAQLEREMIHERQAEGIAQAKQRGVYERTPKLDAEKVAEIRRLAELGVPKNKLARDFGVCKSTIYAVINKTGLYGE